MGETVFESIVHELDAAWRVDYERDDDMFTLAFSHDGQTHRVLLWKRQDDDDGSSDAEAQ